MSIIIMDTSYWVKLSGHSNVVYQLKFSLYFIHRRSNHELSQTLITQQFYGKLIIDKL